MHQLSQKQREVLEQIILFVRESGYPPSIQQLCQRCGVTSTSTIHYHLTTLKRKGYIHWNESERRAITLRADLRDNYEATVAAAEPVVEISRRRVPVLGTIAAGTPLQTTTDTNEWMDLGDDLAVQGCYLLRVRGDSMIEDHIMDGDMVLINPKATVRDGDTVVALIDGESATLKRIYREPDHIRLQPANSTMQPLRVQSADIQGKVHAVIRKI